MLLEVRGKDSSFFPVVTMMQCAYSLLSKKTVLILSRLSTCFVSFSAIANCHNVSCTIIRFLLMSLAHLPAFFFLQFSNTYVGLERDHLTAAAQRARVWDRGQNDFGNLVPQLLGQVVFGVGHQFSCLGHLSFGEVRSGFGDL